MQPFAALLLALTLASSTTASPITDVTVIKQRRLLGPGPVVILPVWSNPMAGTVWQIGSGQCVKWESSTVPPEARASIANLSLGYVETNGSVQIDSKNPLATNITVGSNNTYITVPDPKTLGISASSFVVSLLGPEIFGIDGAVSPPFSITN